jgi:hypothetical protein
VPFLSAHARVLSVQPNVNFCYDAGVAGKMHLHKSAVYQRTDVPLFLDFVIQNYLEILRQKEQQSTAQSTRPAATASTDNG